MDKVQTFTSTGFKFLKKVIQNNDLLYHPKPVSLQVALTERCNLKCSFCSVVNRERKFEFDYEHLQLAVNQFINLGIRTIEITGGGEPLLYPHFSDFVWRCELLGLKVGLITNGILLHTLTQDVLDRFDWVRISMNCLDYVDSIKIPKIRGTLGFSYVFGSDSSYDKLIEINEIAKKNNVSYVRVVPNCLSTQEELNIQHEALTKLVKMVGSPAFYQRKEYGQSKYCYWAYYKPFLYCDEMVYPCSSIPINPIADKSFNETYAICHWSRINEVMYKSPRKDLINTSKCNRCVFQAQNDLIESLKTDIQHEDFV